MRVDLNLSSEIFAAIWRESRQRKITASALMREKLASSLGVKDDFKPRQYSNRNSKEILCQNQP